jgi:hypothetical protein
MTQKRKSQKNSISDEEVKSQNPSHRAPHFVNTPYHQTLSSPMTTKENNPGDLGLDHDASKHPTST